MLYAQTGKALLVSREAHGGQTRRSGMELYYKHTGRVADEVHRYHGSIDAINAAFLHDVLEDTDYPEADLDRLFSARTMALVRLLTKQPGDTDAVYQSRILESGDYELMLIKFCDLTDNLMLDFRFLWEGWEERQQVYLTFRAALAKRMAAL